MATQDKKVPVQHGGKGGNGGKTNEEMLKLGRNLAKVANQKRGK
jgi:hypothetical protein